VCVCCPPPRHLDVPIDHTVPIEARGHLSFRLSVMGNGCAHDIGEGDGDGGG
jgi:hypothetical protein